MRFLEVGCLSGVRLVEERDQAGAIIDGEWRYHPDYGQGYIEALFAQGSISLHHQIAALTLPVDPNRRNHDRALAARLDHRVDLCTSGSPRKITSPRHHKQFFRDDPVNRFHRLAGGSGGVGDQIGRSGGQTFLLGRLLNISVRPRARFEGEIVLQLDERLIMREHNRDIGFEVGAGL